jgi:hypothetical protein
LTFGLPQQVAEGNNYPTTTFNDLGNMIIKPVKFGLSLQVTREALMFNLYKEQCPKIIQQFNDVFKTRENMNAAKIINNGWNPNFPVIDGQPLFSTEHTVQNGSFANTFDLFTPIQENTLEAMVTMSRSFLNTAGLILEDAGAEKIIVPFQSEFQLNRVLKSYLRPGTANNDINSLKYMGYLNNIIGSKFVSATNFAIRTDTAGAVKIENMKLSLQYTANIQNDTLTAVAGQMYQFACWDPRCFVGARQPLNQRAA